MKLRAIVGMSVCMIVAASYVYKYEKTPILSGFPVSQSTEDNGRRPPIILYVFFSKNACRPCLEFFKVLNEMQDRWSVLGLVPKKEFMDVDSIRRMTGAQFPIDSQSKYRRYIPVLNPTLVGATTQGRILFILPGIQNMNAHFEGFLNGFLMRVAPIVPDL